MSVNINLVDNTNSDVARREKVKKFRAISFGILFLTAFLAVIIFAVDYRFSASYVKKQKADLLNELTPYSDNSAKIFIINSKLADISQILNKRADYSDKINKITQSNSGSIVIEEFIIKKEGVEMTFSSSSISVVDEYLNYLIGLVGDEQLSGITLEKFNLDEKGISVELTIT